MFERFSEPARNVVVAAAEEARDLRHNYIGTEHILLGLLRQEQGVAARALLSVGIVVDDVRADVARIIGAGDEVTTGQIPVGLRRRSSGIVGYRRSESPAPCMRSWASR